MTIPELMRHPDREFSPMPFWFLNGDLTVAGMRRQLRDFCDHGVYGVVLHPRIGLPGRIGYLSDTFFGYIRAAVEECARLSMRVALYDEGMYPSGSAGGRVVAENADFASRGILLTDTVLPGDTILADTPRGALVSRRSGGTLRGTHFGEDDGEKNAPPSADILNPEAVNTFIRLTHEQYYARLGEYFGTTIIGFFTDEPSILGRNAPKGMRPWSLGFERLFAAEGGDFAALAALFADEENDDTRLYHRLILRREGEVYYKSLSDWCQSHGVALMGHPHQSDDIEAEKYFHIPGQDLVLRWIAPEKGGLNGMDSVMGKCGVDAARVWGRRRNANECFGACNRDGNPWSLSGGDMKWYIDWLAARGVNLFIPHAFYYSIAGKRRGERPPDVGPNSLWWKHYRLWADYMTRLSCLMTDARLHARVAVLCRNRDLMPDRVRALYERQTGFVYLPQSVWGACAARENRLIYQDMSFDAVIAEDDVFPDVPRYADDFAARDCLCEPEMPDVRAARFTRAGRECWLLVNEGDETLDFSLSLPTDQPVARYDLWRGEATRAGRGRFAVTLPRRANALYYACPQEEYDSLPDTPEDIAVPVPPFALTAHDEKAHVKTYEATLPALPPRAPGKRYLLTLDAEEMVECFVDGALAGVSFWSPHAFDLTNYANGESHVIRLTVSGSLANRYGKRPVPYGLTGA